MIIDYSIFYRCTLDIKSLENSIPYDIFISAFNSAVRVRSVFDKTPAIRKIWLIHPEYKYEENELPNSGELVQPLQNGELEQIQALLEATGDLVGLRVCIDITGFMRHVLVFLIAKLNTLGVNNFTAVYSEPEAYSKQEATIFSNQSTGKVRSIAGMRLSNNEHAQDVLLLGVGFDHTLINEIMNNKDHFVVYPILGFPPLSPDMFQQSAIRASNSGGPALEDAWITNRRFAPANDPFATAGVVAELLRKMDKTQPLPPNIYLSPLSTKVQALGFAIYWVLEGKRRGAVSMLLPECESYSKETSTGLKRLWTYEVELAV
ncbi:hypothetical protein [Comamonas sp.]|uniref:hypothetical protein n=1 Tax=Comamonas sp. TaxID=34028 RepID=UPI0028970759|nr:hypothetical protein [Comamonas sp.]